MNQWFRHDDSLKFRYAPKAKNPGSQKRGRGFAAREVLRSDVVSRVSVLSGVQAFKKQKWLMTPTAAHAPEPAA